ncbi:hypothetical protein [Xanthomonas phage XPV3]|uniref:Uncharacterized protein n=1 Tax=Xanthomonas phage XPV1 TaxID=2099860 RepID=A0A3S7I676_9CAUD|nr:hypothetical protein KEM12_gp02 [Xanthomonas phage XPV1]AVO24166.1 hypothetical protein [Xanthomonas phage XPV1]AVO24369.1 hypothetical protein [Xanthomonas phage XPV3]
MSEMYDFVELKHNARISAAKRSEWVYLRRYAGPTVRRYIATRKPTPTELAHTFFSPKTTQRWPGAVCRTLGDS